MSAWLIAIASADGVSIVRAQRGLPWSPPGPSTVGALINRHDMMPWSKGLGLISPFTDPDHKTAILRLLELLNFIPLLKQVFHCGGEGVGRARSVRLSFAQQL